MSVIIPAAASLEGKKGLILGIANDQSIAWGCAKAFRALGADLAVSYLNEKAKPHVQPLADELGCEIFEPVDVRGEGELKAMFEKIDQKWGKLDFVLHSIAFAPREDLHGRIADVSRDGFAQAMDVSCHSFIRVARYAEPLMEKAGGGTLLTMSYFGAVRVIDNYGVMGPVKAALEAVTRYLAVELGPKHIRVHAVSPGPIKTRAASGINRFDELMEQAAERSPVHRLVTIEEVGATTAFLCTKGARGITGNTIYVDGGFSIVG